jgi:hypothetical protein
MFKKKGIPWNKQDLAMFRIQERLRAYACQEVKEKDADLPDKINSKERRVSLLRQVQDYRKKNGVPPVETTEDKL